MISIQILKWKEAKKVKKGWKLKQSPQIILIPNEGLTKEINIKSECSTNDLNVIKKEREKKEGKSKVHIFQILKRKTKTKSQNDANSREMKG